MKLDDAVATAKYTNHANGEIIVKAASYLVAAGILA